MPREIHIPVHKGPPDDCPLVNNGGHLPVSVKGSITWAQIAAIIGTIATMGGIFSVWVMPKILTEARIQADQGDQRVIDAMRRERDLIIRPILDTMTELKSTLRTIADKVDQRK